MRNSKITLLRVWPGAVKFKHSLRKFPKIEKKAVIWDKCFSMYRERENRVHAALYLLATWNTGSFNNIGPYLDVQDLSDKLEVVEGMIARLRGLRINEFYDLHPTTLDSLEDQVKEIFIELSEILSFGGPKWQYVAASKVLSLSMPELSIMWDNNILDAYCKLQKEYPLLRKEGAKLEKNIDHENCGVQYFRFLKLMHKLFVKKELIEVYSKIKQTKTAPYYFSKAIDEYNYTTLTKGE